MNRFQNKAAKKQIVILAVIFLSIFLFNHCSLNKFAMNKVANILTSPSGGTVFTGDNDPDLVGDALPFAIKMYESLMVSIPNHEGLRLKTGSLYIMYANAFLQAPASMLEKSEYKKQEYLYRRAKNLYLRGRDIVLEALEHKYPGFLKDLKNRQYDRALRPMKKGDIPLLYWGGAGWLGAFAIDPFDMDIGLTIPGAAALMNWVFKIDEQYGKGAIHEFYVLYYGSLPEYMGGDLSKARSHFKKALEVSKGQSTSAYLSLATTVAVKEQNMADFKELLSKVLEFDPESDPSNRLLNTINQRKARWFLEHVSDFFVESEDEKEDIQ